MILSLTDEKNCTKEIWRKIKSSAKAKAQMKWWINNIDNSCYHINIPCSDITLYTDKSLADWVSLTVYLHPGDSGIILEHIHVLGLKAVKIGIYT